MPPLVLEDFSAPARVDTAAHAPDPVTLTEEARLAAYEDGYKAGWDDANAAADGDRARISADFAKCLQEMSFSYHEARAHLMNGLGPLLAAISEKLVPDLAEQGFQKVLQDAVRKSAEAAMDGPLELVVTPENQSLIDGLMDEDAPRPPLIVTPDPTLSPGQAYLRSGSSEISVDMGEAIAGIQSAISAYLMHDSDARKAS